MELKKRGNKIVYIISVIAVLIIIGAVLFSKLYIPECKDLQCFKAELWKCSKASFTSDGENSTWFYSINGLSVEGCKVYVKSISVNEPQ